MIKIEADNRTIRPNAVNVNKQFIISVKITEEKPSENVTMSEINSTLSLAGKEQ